jgi:hypothetical protein
MPIYKYKTFEEADQALWNFNPGSDFFREIDELFSMAEKLNPINCQKGLWKFRTIEDARQQRLETELQNAHES